MIPAPFGSHASEVVDSPRYSGEGGKNDEGIGAVVRKVREQESNPQAEENQKGSAKKRAIARIEDAWKHSTVSRVEGFPCGRASDRTSTEVFRTTDKRNV